MQVHIRGRQLPKRTPSPGLTLQTRGNRSPPQRPHQTRLPWWLSAETWSTECQSKKSLDPLLSQVRKQSQRGRGRAQGHTVIHSGQSYPPYRTFPPSFHFLCGLSWLQGNDRAWLGYNAGRSTPPSRYLQSGTFPTVKRGGEKALKEEVWLRGPFQAPARQPHRWSPSPHVLLCADVVRAAQSRLSWPWETSSGLFWTRNPPPAPPLNQNHVLSVYWTRENIEGFVVGGPHTSQGRRKASKNIWDDLKSFKIKVSFKDFWPRGKQRVWADFSRSREEIKEKNWRSVKEDTATPFLCLLSWERAYRSLVQMRKLSHREGKWLVQCHTEGTAELD